MPLEYLDAHQLANDCRGDMVRRPSHEAIADLCPCLERLPTPDKSIVSSGHLPAAIDPPCAAFRNERHQFDVFSPGLIVVEECCRGNGIAVRRVFGDIVNTLTVDVDGSPVSQRFEVLFEI